MGFAVGGEVGSDVAELGDDLVVFEVEALDGEVEAGAFDNGPVGDGGDGGEGIAEVGLLEGSFGAGAFVAVDEELFGGKAGVAGAVDDVKEAELDGVGHGDAVIKVPGSGTGAGFEGELVEEGVVAAVGGPEGDIEAQGDAALGSFPKEFGVRVPGDEVS